LGLAAIAIPFLPFTLDELPVGNIWDWSGIFAFGPLVIFCVLLPVPIGLGYLLWLKTGFLPRWWALTSYLLAAASASLCVAFWVLVMESAVLSLLFSGAFACAAWLLTRGIKGESAPRALLTSQTVYTVPLTFWLVVALDDFQIGAWLGVVVLLTYLGQILLALRSLRWRLLWLLTLILVAMISVAGMN
jgi:hypothetical protein